MRRWRSLCNDVEEAQLEVILVKLENKAKLPLRICMNQHASEELGVGASSPYGARGTTETPFVSALGYSPNAVNLFSGRA
jgi:hypothetical protein